MNKSRAHAIAGIVAMTMVLCFWSATLFSELFMSYEYIAFTKRAILYGLLILIPSMAVTGLSGAVLGRNRTGAVLESKKRRMKILAMTGLLIMLPSAFFLAMKSAADDFDSAFYVIQAVELAGGIVQFTLLVKNFRDGLTLAKRSPNRNLRELYRS